MLEEIRTSECGDVSRCIPNYMIEVIKPECMEVHKIIFADEFTYVHNGVEDEMWDLLDVSGDEDIADDIFFEKLYDFIKKL